MSHTLRRVCAALETQADRVFPDGTDFFLDYWLDTGDFWAVKPGESGEQLWYKNYVRAVSLGEIGRMVQPLSTLRWKDAADIPYFVRDLDTIRDAMENGRPRAIEGGPCLFGAWEVFMEITLSDGTCVTYDYNTSSRVVGEDYDLSAPPLADFVCSHAAEIIDICFRDSKDSLTGQEIDSVLYLFEAGKALDAVVILSIPDMSYSKFLAAVTACLPEALQAQTISRFRQVAYRITDLYLELARMISAEYPEVKYTPVHEREKEICAAFYEKREPFIERNRVLRKIGSSAYRLESVKDYISLSGLPMYLYGITDVLHICSLDEADSFRKCREAHKGHLQLSCMLYPEYVSADGENTVFYAKKQYKDYMKLSDYKERMS